jgi:NADH-quinone oxidoreductase subunit A
VFLLANLVLGRFIRPFAPNQEKLEIYECGEPTIGSSFVQFDLRFYVVALLFIIFDVEVAFFFPWASVFGKAAQVQGLESAADARTDAQTARTGNAESSTERERLKAENYAQLAESKFAELGVPRRGLEGILSEVPANPREQPAAVAEVGRRVALFSFYDILVFFAVLMVGFFYVWKRGDLDWVRAVSRERSVMSPRAPPGAPPPVEEPVLAR